MYKIAKTNLQKKKPDKPQRKQYTICSKINSDTLLRKQ